MKILPMLLAGLMAAFLTEGARAQEIECSPASTRLDRAICADELALDYQRRMAAAHAGALAVWSGAIGHYARLDQQEWITGFRTMELETAFDSDCVLSDPVCIREELRRRVDDLESRAYIYSGVYRAAGGMKLLLHPARANGYRVRIYDPARASQVNIVTRDGERTALWDGPHVMVSLMGDANGLPLPEEDGCTLRMQPEALAMRVSQKGACGGHSFEGTYDRLLGETLRGYELELH